ncbi:hypothetical protein AQI84_40235 [Streptomyces griseorubiginosus]|nr:hypothetical protein AQI84_40235 [Streptomyces griseorubiginosus]
MVTTRQPLRIPPLGTHSTGRTTLLKRIQMELRAPGVAVGAHRPLQQTCPRDRLPEDAVTQRDAVRHLPRRA